jgi:predicted adenine nucleotide alpha hydrolase (AANH) superfamily ATPase
MNVLLHICCGPCAAGPVEMLKEEGTAVSCCFFNPNVHPYLEHQKRLESSRRFCELADVPLVGDPRYELEQFLRLIVNHEHERCPICYRYRLEEVALVAKREGFDAFSTTLLVSPYQKHDIIVEIGHEVGQKVGVAFYYKDFRPSWSKGRRIAKEMALYRQQYCGCIYSEKERYMG